LAAKDNPVYPQLVLKVFDVPAPSTGKVIQAGSNCSNSKSFINRQDGSQN
jgi:hypothetical protein